MKYTLQSAVLYAYVNRKLINTLRYYYSRSKNRQLSTVERNQLPTWGRRVYTERGIGCTLRAPGFVHAMDTNLCYEHMKI